MNERPINSAARSIHLHASMHNEKDKEERIIPFYKKMNQSEYHVYSQNNEDGIIQFLTNLLNITNGFYVEFGTQSAKECNTRLLREKYNWTGLLMDGSFEKHSINLQKEKIHHSNIVQLLEKYNVPLELDLFSEDTDYADYWIMEAVFLANYRPKIVIVEVNQQPPHKCVTTKKSDEILYWDETEYHGASVCAFNCLAKRFNYTMVYCERRGVNCFMVRNDLLENVLQVNITFVRSILTPHILFKQANFSYSKTDNQWHRVVCD